VRANVQWFSLAVIVLGGISTALGTEAVSAGSTTPEADPTRAELSRLVAAGRLDDLRWPDFSDYRGRIQAFYESGAYALAWTDHGVPTPQAKALMEAFKNAADKGLDAEDYDGSRWAARLAPLPQEHALGPFWNTEEKSQTAAAGFDPARFDLARFDLTMTVGAMRYVSDLHLGRANPGIFDGPFDLEREKNEMARFVRDRLVHAADVNAALDSIEPPYEGYRRTEQALEKYLALVGDSAGSSILALPTPAKPVEPGKAYSNTGQLAALLRQLGDLPREAALPANPDVYGGPLVAAVKRFQTRHGLLADGRIGKATVAELNTPLSQRVRQLQLSLERWRWVPHSFAVPPVVVNIPEFELRALDGDYRTELEMKVIVGKSYHHQTPVFSAEMSAVGFRPYWDVPLSIQRAELVPKLMRDHDYLVKNTFEVVNAKREVVSSGEVDDALIAKLRSLQLFLRQVPGPKNSLGLIKFSFPNRYDVYMHDTPATELFSQSRRDFSHGCIRVEKPEQLAAWVLRDKPEWTPERIHEAMHGDKTFEVRLDHPIPVLIVYATAVVLANGDVHFFDDIYGLDAQLEETLAKAHP